MRRWHLLPLIVMTAISPAGCGDGEETTTGETGTATAAATTTASEEKADTSATAAELPDDIDFGALGEEFVAAAAAGDCETFADLQGWSEDSQNRDTSIANCELVAAELAGLGEPSGTSAREEALAGDEVQVWVTRDYADGSQWEMQMVVRNSTAANRDEGWVISTYSY